METLLRLFFDLTANDGWNGIAIVTYLILIGLGVTFITEMKRG